MHTVDLKPKAKLKGFFLHCILVLTARAAVFDVNMQVSRSVSIASVLLLQPMIPLSP